MYIESHRFGKIEVSEDEIIHMVRPVLGFESLTKYFLHKSEESAPFLWMQSIEDPSVAFVIANPCLFSRDYKIELNPNEISEIKPDNPDSVDIYVIVNIPEEPRKTTVNLQGPILINRNNRKGKQLVLMNSDYQVQQTVFDEKMSNVYAEERTIDEPVVA